MDRLGWTVAVVRLHPEATSARAVSFVRALEAKVIAEKTAKAIAPNAAREEKNARILEARRRYGFD